MAHYLSLGVQRKAAHDSTYARVLAALVVLPLTLMVALAAPAAAHEERPAGFPDGTGVVPKYLGLDNANHRVVCTTASASRIAAMPAGPLKTRNQQLLGECRYRSIQTAINSIQRAEHLDLRPARGVRRDASGPTPRAATTART